MTQHRTNRSIATVLGVVLIGYYCVLAIVANGGPDANRRHATLLELGARTSARAGTVATSGEDVTIGSDAGYGQATWSAYAYETGRLVRSARACRMSVALVGLHLTSARASGYADVLVNDTVVKRITFAGARRGSYPVAQYRLVPANVWPEAIELVPLDPEYGFLIPIPDSYCSAASVSIGVRVHDATWTVEHAGVVLAYTPSLNAFFGPVVGISLGTVLLAILIACLFAVLYRISTLGVRALAIAAAILAFAPLSYDQWDFRLWLGFAEFGVFSGGDPAYLWFGSPGWTFVPSLFATIVAAGYAMTGHGSQGTTALLMKVGMGLAYCYSAAEIARRAPARLRPFVAAVALLLPVGLFELAGGYRELFAGALAIASLAASSRRRLVLATVLSVAAASISEEFLPMALLPATLALATPGERAGRRGARAAALAAGAVALFALEWNALIPHDFARSALGYRFGPAPLGGASWAAALDGLGLLPAWLPAAAPLFDVALFAALAAAPAYLCYRSIVRGNAVSFTVTFERVVGAYVAFVAAFLVAFRGTDPNLWYSLGVVAFWFFAAENPLSPFPLVLATIEGLAFYVTVGFRDFVNQAYFWPVDKGLLGTLSTTRFVLDLMASAMMVALIVAIARGDTLAMFSRKTFIFVVLFFAAVAATATSFYVLDIVVCAAAVASVVYVTARLIAADRRYLFLHAGPLARGAGVTALAVVGAACATHNAGAGLCASATCLIAARSRLGSCDVIFGAGTFAVLAVQPGSGVVSALGWIAVVVVLVSIVVDDVTSPRSAPAYSTQA